MNKFPDSFPNTAQQLFLRAATASKRQEMETCFQSWIDSVDLEATDQATHKLIPVLLQNMAYHDIQHEVLKRLRGVALFQRLRNERIISGTIPTLRLLQQNKVSLLFLKGLPLLVNQYGDTSLRGIEDVDILVQPGDLRLAVNVLLDAEWRPEFESFRDFDSSMTQSYITLRHGCQFEGQNGAKIDLHWQVLQECFDDSIATDCWESAVPFDFRGISAKTLSPEYMLIHVCAHGARRNELPPIRWVVDAIKILNKNNLDWDLLTERAIKMRLNIALAYSLLFLKTKLNYPVPTQVLKSLEQTPDSKSQTKELFMSGSKEGALNDLKLYYVWYRRALYYHPVKWKCFGFVRYLQYLSGQPGLSSLTQMLAKRFANFFSTLLLSCWRKKSRS